MPAKKKAAKSRPKKAAKPKPRKNTKPLDRYSEKRDFSRTSEPEPRVSQRQGWQFCVQKHDARRLHFDLRLELDGVLKSWAVTRGPSLVPGDKRLAVQTEDHPLDYLEWEGMIPKGEYGGGTMIVWDRGTWTPQADPHKGLAKGHLDFSLEGERLKGKWHLVRMQKKRGEKKDPWLLIKSRDEHARAPGSPEIVEEEMTSTLSGRTNEDLARSGAIRADHAARANTSRIKLPDLARIRGTKKGILPPFVEPNLARSTDEAPSGEQWLHEIKYDGYRTQARIDGGKVKLLTRKGLNWSGRFPTIAAALKVLPFGSALIDGEIIVPDESGVSNFANLQSDLKDGRHDRVAYMVFDLLYLEGVDLRGAKLSDRKELLAQVIATLPPDGAVRMSDHMEGDGDEILQHACRLGLEGIVSKHAGKPYRSGRGEHWLKSKCVLRQEFVVIGYVPSTAIRNAVGSLVLGYYQDGKLLHAGRAGTGFSEDEAKRLRDKLHKIAGPRPELPKRLPAGAEKGVKWVEPSLVAEVEYRGWTSDKLVRQASYKGLRDDKDAKEVVLETAVAIPKRRAPSISKFRLTHPERILWDEQGITKLGLAEFYAEIADWILPHVVGRPLSLVRCPSGAGEQCFYAKHAWKGMSDAIHPVDIGEGEEMLAIADLEGLIALVQASVLEIHPWGSAVGNLDKPDRLIIDLDPGDGVAWSAVIDAAKEVRDRLKRYKLKSFVKTSGGKGLHVVFPLTPSADWKTAKAFTARVAQEMVSDNPHQYIDTMTKKLRTGKIFVDFFRNDRGSTAVAAYSTRAKKIATIATPLEWSELSETIKADHFTIDNLKQRLDFLKRDPWTGFFKLKQKLPR